jgi:hypothetical protein
MKRGVAHLEGPEVRRLGSTRALRELRRRPGRQHPPRQAEPGHRGHPGNGPGQGRVPQPRRVREGPHRDADPRRRGGLGGAGARRDDRRADLGQHRRRPGARGPAARLPLRVRPARQGRRGQAERPDGIRRRDRRHADGGPARAPRVVLLGVRPARAGDPRRIQAEPVREPERPAQPLRDDGPGDLAGHRGAADPLRGWRRHRRHDLRHRQVPEGGLRGPRAHHRRRPRGLRVLGWDGSPVPGRGRRGGLLAERLRPRHRGRDHRRVGRRLVRHDPASRPGGRAARRRLQRDGRRRRPARRP